MPTIVQIEWKVPLHQTIMNIGFHIGRRFKEKKNMANLLP
jgi:hypothetical protein